MKNLVIFDLDGTLVDSLADLADAVNYTLQKLHQNPVDEEYVKKSIGDGARKLIERCAPSLNHKEIDQAMDIFLPYYDAHCTVKTRLYPGVKDWLEILKARGLKIALLTNKPEIPSRHIVKALGVDSYFDAIIGGDTLSEKKPSPLGIHTLISQFNIPQDQVLMVGDGTPDIESAQACGVECIAILNGIGFRESLLKLQPDHIVESFSEIPLLPEIAYGSLNER